MGGGECNMFGVLGLRGVDVRIVGEKEDGFVGGFCEVKGDGCSYTEKC